MRRGRILILFALILILGVVAAYLLLRPDGEVAEATPTPGPGEVPSDMVMVVVAAQDIARGSEIPRDAIVLQQMPADMVVETWIAGTDEETLFSQVQERRARIDIARGIPVTTAMITEKAGDLLGAGSDAAIAIPPGYTAIAIPMTRLSGVAYALRDGDTVDILITMLMVDLNLDFQTMLPDNNLMLVDSDGNILTGSGCYRISRTEMGLECSNDEPPPVGGIVTDEDTGVQLYAIPSEAQRPRLFTQRLVEAATVLHVGTFPLEDIEEEIVAIPSEAEGVGAPPPEQGETEVVALTTPDIVTLIVTPQDALALNWAVKNGADIVLTLRAPGDTLSTDTVTVTLQYLIDNYNITVPAKLPYGIEPSVDQPIVPVLPNDTVVTEQSQ
jgi:Flp pilus assembly protein CpaB